MTEILKLKGKKTLRRKSAPSGAIHTCHPSKWIQLEPFTQRFKHFLQLVKPTATLKSQIQPLDKTFMRSLNKYLAYEIRKRGRM